MKSGGRQSPARTDLRSRVPAGINLGLGAVMVVVAALGAASVPATHAGWRFTVVALAVAAFAALTLDPRALFGVAVLGWLVVNGFLVDRLGELSWHGPSDLYRIVLLAMAGALGLAAGEAYRRAGALRSRLIVEARERARAAQFRFDAFEFEFDEKERRDA